MQKGRTCLCERDIPVGLRDVGKSDGHMTGMGGGWSTCVVGGGVSGGAHSLDTQLLPPPPPPFRTAEMKNWSAPIKIHRSNKHFRLPKSGQQSSHYM